MSSADFIHVLKEVGYPKAHKLNPSDWDWMFELGGGSGAFLSWLCRNVSAGSVLSETERAAFGKLRETEGVLEGTRLDAALASQEEADGDLQQEVTKLQTQLDNKKALLEKLKCTRDQLCNETLSLSTELQQLSESQSAARSGRHRLRQRLTADELVLQGARGRLETAARALTGQLTETPDALLSQTPLDGVEAAERQVTERLAELSARAFGRAGLRGEECGLVDLRSSRLAEDAGHARLAAQMARLEVALPAAKRGAQAASAEVVGLREALIFAKRLLDDPAQRAVMASCSQTSPGPDPELEQALTAACERYVQCVLARAVVGDHALKLERQEAALARQARVRAAAVQQLARLEWLRRAVEAESASIADAGNTLTEASRQAAERADKLQHRLRQMERLSTAAAAGTASDDPPCPLLPAPAPPAAGPAPAPADPLADQRRRLRAACRLDAALVRSGVAARCARLDHAARGVQPELKALVKQWEERRATRRPEHALWQLMMTAPSKLESLVERREAEARGEEAVRAGQ